MMDIASALVARDEPAQAVDPGEGAFDHPSMAAQLLTGLDAAPGDAGHDPATAASLSAAPMIVGLVGVELVWPVPHPACLAADRLNGVEQFLERHAVAGIGTCEEKGERNATALGDQMAFCAQPASIGRVRPCLVTPLFAASDALSRHARLKSSLSAARNRGSSSWCRRSQTPASCQSRRRRQHVMPDPHPISSASISHWMAVFKTNRIPVSAARSGTRGLPPRGRGGTTGSRGSMIDQSASGTRAEAMAPHESNRQNAQGF